MNRSWNPIPVLAIVAGGSLPLLPDDCNRNGREDFEEIASDPGLDCNRNGILDTCDLRPGIRIEPLAEKPIEFRPVHLTAGDLDNDGNVDLAVLVNDPGSHALVLRNAGAGALGPPEPYPTGSYSTHVVSVDLDGDLDLDLAVASPEWSPLFLCGNVRTLENRGDGAFEPAVAVADPVCFYRPDFLVPIRLAPGEPPGLLVKDLETPSLAFLANDGRGNLAFAELLDHAAGYQARDTIRVADLDGDGFHDAASAANGGGVVLIFNRPVDEIRRSLRHLTATGVAGDWLVEAEDLDRDGTMDLASVNGRGLLTVLQNLGEGTTFRTQHSWRTDSFPVAIRAGDLDANESPDLVVAARVGPSLQVFLDPGIGPPSFGDPPRSSKYLFESWPMDFVLADIEGDGDLDITVLSGRSGRIEPGQAQGEVAILAGDGKGGFTLAGAMGMDFRPAAFSLLRFDGDGADVALVSEQRPAVHLASLETGAPASLDLNADGIPDECVATIFARGDVDASGALDLTDAIALLWSLFLGAEPPGCEKAADADDDGELKITDAVSILGHLFLGGARLPEPSGDCGSDPTDDALTCASSSACDR